METSRIDEIKNGQLDLIIYTYGKNKISIKKCNRPDYTDFMEIQAVFNTVPQINLGHGSVNIRRVLADVKTKGYKGLVFFEEKESGIGSLSKVIKQIANGYVEKQFVKVEKINECNVYTFE